MPFCYFITDHYEFFISRYNLNKSFIRDGLNSMYDANLIGVVHDVSNAWTKDRIDIKLLHMLEELKWKPSFLILNKVCDQHFPFKYFEKKFSD